MKQSIGLVVISFHLLTSVAPTGVMTGFGFGPASAHDQRLLETFLAARAFPTQRLPTVGEKAQGVYIADKGFAGDKPHAVWRERFGAEVITPPHQTSHRKWPKEWRRWRASPAPTDRVGLRQIADGLSSQSDRHGHLL